MVQPQPGALVDVLAGAQSLHQGPDGFIDEGHQHPVDDEARIVERGDRRLAHRLAQAERGGHGGVRCIAAARDLHQGHDGHGVEEVHADEAVGALRHRRHAGDRDRGRVAGQDGLRPADAVEPLEEVPLGLEALGDRLDHEVGPPGGLQRCGRMQALEGGVTVRRGQLALLHLALQSPADPLHPPCRQRLLDLPQGDVHAAGDRGLGDARAHQPRSRDVYLHRDYHTEPHRLTAAGPRARGRRADRPGAGYRG